MICPYCGGKVVFKKSSDFIYGKDYGSVYVCENYPKCDAYCGCHDGTDKPLGIVANRELRNKRKACHVLFDALWKSGKRSRMQAYSMLAHTLGIPVEDCHVAMFDEAMCEKMLNLFKGGDRSVEKTQSIIDQKNPEMDV